MTWDWNTDDEIKVALKGAGNSEERTARVQTVLARRLVEAVDRHAAALMKAAAASDKYSKWIAFATAGLVLATLALVWATLKIGVHA